VRAGTSHVDGDKTGVSGEEVNLTGIGCGFEEEWVAESVPNTPVLGYGLDSRTITNQGFCRRVFFLGKKAEHIRDI